MDNAIGDGNSKSVLQKNTTVTFIIPYRIIKTILIMSKVEKLISEKDGNTTPRDVLLLWRHRGRSLTC